MFIHSGAFIVNDDVAHHWAGFVTLLYNCCVLLNIDGMQHLWITLHMLHMMIAIHMVSNKQCVVVIMRESGEVIDTVCCADFKSV